MIQTRFVPLLLGIGGVLLFCGCRDMGGKDAVASYSYSAGAYSETVALRPNGKYLQTETQKPSQDSVSPLTFKQTGTWLLLDRSGGTPLPLPASVSDLPKSAVVEIKSAFPFGQTFENQSPFSLVADRIIPASEFSIEKP